MAYTYDEFVSAAKKANMMDRFSQQDLQTAQSNPEYGISLLNLMKDSSNATTTQQRLLATETANQLRKSYGVYNTGNLGEASSAYASSYGSKIDDLLGQINDYGSYDYGNQEQYQKILDSVTNPEGFSYDPETDPSYASYKKQYMREGERASANALAQTSAASGGRVSSYAATAAQQASDYYAAQLADVIPTLETNAYSRYLSDYNNKLSSLSALQNDREYDYQKWMDAYNMLQNSLSNYQSKDATDYQRYLDAYNLAYQAEQDRLAQAQQKYENELAERQLLAATTAKNEEDSGENLNEVSSGSGSESASGTNQYGGALYSLTKEIQKTVPKQTSASSTGSGTANLNGEVDMASVLALGYGAIDAEELAELVAEGKVEVYQEGNLIKARKVETSFGKTGNSLAETKIPSTKLGTSTGIIHGGSSGKF